MAINATKQSLLNLPRAVKRGVVIFADLLVCGFSVWLAFGLRLDEWGYFQTKQWIVFLAAIGFSFYIRDMASGQTLVFALFLWSSTRFCFSTFALLFLLPCA